MKDQRLSRFFEIHSDWIIAGTITLVVLLVMGLRIFQFGLFSDQWNGVINFQFNASNSLVEAFIQKSLVQVIGSNVILYHVVNLFLFCLAGYLVYVIFKNFLFGIPYSLAGSLLFIFSPAFGQPAAGFELSSILAGFILVLASLVLSFEMISNQRFLRLNFVLLLMLWTIVLLGHPIVIAFQCVVSIFLLIIAFIKKRKFSLAIGGFCLNLIVSLGALFFSSPVTIFSKTPVINKALQSMIDGFFISWRQILAMPESGAETVKYLVGLVIGIGLIYILLKTLNNLDISKKSSSETELMSLIVPVFAAFMSGLLFLLISSLVNIDFSLSYPSDFNMLIPGFFVSIFLISFVRLVFIQDYHLIILALIIGLSTGTRYLASDKYIDETQKVNDLLAQLHVRGDSISQNTTLISEQLPFDFTSLRSLEALFNSEFMNESGMGSIKLIQSDSSEIRNFLSNQSINSTILELDERSIEIQKDRIISFWMPDNGCVEILQPGLVYGTIPEGLKPTIDFSNITLFKSENTSDVKQLDRFRTTIDKEWCFHYQLANRWAASEYSQKIIDEYRSVQESGLEPERYQEHFPFLKALISTAKIEEAKDLSQKILKNPSALKSVCDQWSLILTSGEISEEVVSEGRTALNEIGCD